MSSQEELIQKIMKRAVVEVMMNIMPLLDKIAEDNKQKESEISLLKQMQDSTEKRLEKLEKKIAEGLLKRK